MKVLAGSFRLFAVLAAMVFAIGFSACGDDSSDSGGQQQAPAPNASDQSENTSACDIVTQSDATQLFGKPAVKDEGAMVVDPAMSGECLWSWESEEYDSQLLQVRIWNGNPGLYYTETADVPGAQALDIGDRGHVTVTEGALGGVDIEWLQDGKTVSLTYSTVGNGVPDPEDKVEELKQLAQKASDKL